MTGFDVPIEAKWRAKLQAVWQIALQPHARKISGLAARVERFAAVECL